MARLFLFNRVWSQAPELWEEIASRAGRAQVVLADESDFTLRDLSNGFSPPIHLLNVSPAREVPEWIKVEIALA